MATVTTISLVEMLRSATVQDALECTEIKREPGDILDEAIDHAEAMLPHGIELLFERNLCRRTYDVTAQCPHCGAQKLAAEITYCAIEDAVSTAALGSALCLLGQRALPKCAIATCGDPMERYVDGLTVRQCLARFTVQQRNDHGAERLPLTTAQKEAARAAWSAQLKAKVQQAEEKQRVAVVVDDDRWEE